MKFAKSCNEFTDHIIAHIEKEENSVFPKIEQALAQPEDRRIYIKFEEYANRFGAGFYKRSEEFAKKIQNEVLGKNYFEGLARQ